MNIGIKRLDVYNIYYMYIIYNMYLLYDMFKRVLVI